VEVVTGFWVMIAACWAVILGLWVYVIVQRVRIHRIRKQISQMEGRR